MTLHRFEESQPRIGEDSSLKGPKKPNNGTVFRVSTDFRGKGVHGAEELKENPAAKNALQFFVSGW